MRNNAVFNFDNLFSFLLILNVLPVTFWLEKSIKSKNLLNQISFDGLPRKLYKSTSIC